MVALSTIVVWRCVPPTRHRWPMMDTTTAERWMRVALSEATAALGHGDVPVGAVVVAPDGTGLSRGRNRREQSGDPTAHAELEALRAAARSLGTWRLDGCTLVVTLEPCAMCAGALVQARVAQLVFGADDPKAGAVTSLFDLVRDPRLPHRVEVHRGVLAPDCAAVLRSFFANRR
jgi:tRNA(adenine34) deaminase